MLDGNDSVPVQKPILSEELRNETYDHVKNILDEMRETFSRSPGETISRGAVELAYSRIAPYLSDYMGAVFEEICKQYLWHRLLFS